ncbi:unnamed protein product [Symbiodinium sp. CCMP2592]|nr:unnamed protein product [Symbiodinium sp. CCMP2592]
MALFRPEADLETFNADQERVRTYVAEAPPGLAATRYAIVRDFILNKVMTVVFAPLRRRRQSFPRIGSDEFNGLLQWARDPSAPWLKVLDVSHTTTHSLVESAVGAIALAMVAGKTLILGAGDSRVVYTKMADEGLRKAVSEQAAVKGLPHQSVDPAYHAAIAEAVEATARSEENLLATGHFRKLDLESIRSRGFDEVNAGRPFTSSHPVVAPVMQALKDFDHLAAELVVCEDYTVPLDDRVELKGVQAIERLVVNLEKYVTAVEKEFLAKKDLLSAERCATKALIRGMIGLPYEASLDQPAEAHSGALVDVLVEQSFHALTVLAGDFAQLKQVASGTELRISSTFVSAHFGWAADHVPACAEALRKATSADATDGDVAN